MYVCVCVHARVHVCASHGARGDGPTVCPSLWPSTPACRWQCRHEPTRGTLALVVGVLVLVASALHM